MRNRARYTARTRTGHIGFSKLALGALLGLALIFSVAVSFFHPQPTSAATSDTINFQARLENSDGSIVNDGDYNVEFKLYNTSSGGSALWTEDYLNSASQGVQVVNGYLTVNLGAVTSFPSNINWSQQLWLTMNIGGTTASPSWDGEMNPRLLLTAIPYAFQAGSATQLQDTSGSNTATLSFATPTAADSITLPDASGTVCLQSSSSCNFAASSGDGSYIQNGLTTQTANFYIQSAAAGDVGAVIKAASGQTADLQDWDNSSGGVLARVTSAGNFAVTAGNGYYLNGTCAILEGNTSFQAELTNSCTSESSLPSFAIREVSGQTADLLQLQNSSGTVLSHFDDNGNLIVGSSAASSGGVLTVGANTTAASGGIYFGTDTDLYRLNTGDLKTDGTLEVQSNLQVAENNTGKLYFGSAADTDLYRAAAGDLRTDSTFRVVGENLQAQYGQNAQVTLGSQSGGTGNAEIYFGSATDTDLYRSSAGVLKTDGSLIVGTLASSGTTVLCEAGGQLETCGSSAGSGNYIFNQTASPQTAGFNISGNGTIGGTLAVTSTINTSASYEIGSTPVLQAPGTGNILTGAGVGTSGSYNAALGYYALHSNTGSANVAIGYETMENGSGGTDNTAVGTESLQANAGNYNAALGYQALVANTTGADNTAVGTVALKSNSTGNYNTAVGYQSLALTTGSNNSALGVNALENNTSGSQNIALGFGAGVTGTVGNANSTGSYNTFIGYNSGPGTATQLQAATAIGTYATVNESNALVLGCVSGTNGCGTSTLVGIDTSTPDNKIQVAGLIDFHDSLQTTALGTNALQGNTGMYNTAVGYNALSANTNGEYNVALGGGALLVNTTGVQNTAIGYSAMESNTTGYANVAIGMDALQSNSTGDQNVAIGMTALQNAVGSDNVGIGHEALESDVGDENIAIGTYTLSNGTTGSYNEAVGYNALRTNTGDSNAAFGDSALGANTSGSDNVGIGNSTLDSNTTGSGNVALGWHAGITSNTSNANTTGSNNTFLGYESGPGSTTQLQNATSLGTNSVVNGNNTLTLGCVNGVNGCTATTNIGIASGGYANNPLTVAATTYSTGTITQSGTAITGSGTTFTSGMTGGTIYYADGTTATVTYVSATSLTSSVSKTISSGQSYTIVYGGFNITGTGTALLQPTTDSTSAFQVQDTGGTSLLDVDTTDQIVNVGMSTFYATSGSQTFNYSGSTQTFTVPSGVTSINVTLYGAQGGTGYGGGAGGAGGETTGTISVTPGEVLTIVTGGQGGNGSSGATAAAGGYGGGGGTGAPTNSSYSSSGGGGGMSAIETSGGTYLAIAGGGGGGGTAYAYIGGVGGGLTGGTSSGNGRDGGGGTQTAGGTVTIGNICDTIAPTTGSAYQGGTGGSGAGYSGGGGGGGYYGGGGGDCATASGVGAGGGGSSLVPSGGTTTSGVQSGNGQVTIQYNATPENEPLAVVDSVSQTVSIGVAGLSRNSQTFNYTGNTQTYTVPAGVTSVSVTLDGAQGGSSNGGSAGGLGGETTGTLTVTPGEVLTIIAGGQGGNGSGSGGGTAGYGGGGTGNGSGIYKAGGGGGYSLIENGSTPLAIAGGGGGAGGGSGTDTGGTGGGTTGGNGSSTDEPGNIGYGGTQSAGGSGGYDTAGSYEQGGAGNYGGPGSCGGGGGGGGGYYGGGGAAACGGGGGGSALVPSGGTTTNGVNSGNGQVTIQDGDYTPTPLITADSSNTTVTIAGDTVVQPTANSATAFQVQNASGSQVFNIDTANTANTDTMWVGQTGQGSLAFVADLGGAGYNNIAQSGDEGLIFAGSGGINTGDLVIAPWSNTSAGIRITYNGYVCIDTGTCSHALGVSGTGVASGGFSTGTPDMAEYIDASSNVGVGDVVIADPNNTEAVTDTTTPYDSAEVGVIANGTSGFQMLNAHYGQAFDANTDTTDPHAKPMTIAGRVPVNVTGEGGSIKPGDYLTTSSTSGYAMKATHAGPTIGKALGFFNSTSGSDTGTVLVLVTPGYYGGPNPSNNLQDGDSVTFSSLNVSGDTALRDLNVTGTATVGSLAVEGDLAVGGSVNATSADIANALSAGTLNLSGPATVLGLTVNGSSIFNGDITVNGHIITSGNAPTTAVSAAAGTQQVNGASQNEGTCQVSGNDTSGTITLVTGANNLASGTECTLTFAKSFGSAPRSMLSALDKNSLQIGAYLTPTTTNAALDFINTPIANQTYTFNYWNPQ